MSARPPVNLLDLEEAAAELLDPAARDYYRSVKP